MRGESAQEDTECPRCNALQRFVRHVRPANDGDWLESYIRCNACHWERVLGVTSKKLERLYSKSRVFAQIKDYEMGRHGVVSSATVAAHRRIHKRIGAELTRINTLVRETRGTDTA